MRQKINIFFFLDISNESIRIFGLAYLKRFIYLKTTQITDPQFKKFDIFKFELVSVVKKVAFLSKQKKKKRVEIV